MNQSNYRSIAVMSTQASRASTDSAVFGSIPFAPDGVQFAEILDSSIVDRIVSYPSGKYATTVTAIIASMPNL